MNCLALLPRPEASLNLSFGATKFWRASMARKKGSVHDPLHSTIVQNDGLTTLSSQRSAIPVGSAKVGMLATYVFSLAASAAVLLSLKE